MTSPARTALAGVVALAVLVTAACGSQAGAGPTTTTAPTPSGATAAATAAPGPTATPPADPTTPDAEPAEADFSPASTELTRDGDASGYVVTQVRVGEHPGYDRVVYELTGGEGAPGYRVGWVGEAVEDPSGEVRQVAGDAVLRVRLIGTTYPAEGGPQEHAQDVLPTRGGIAQVVRPLTFEGMTQSFVGVDGDPRPFRVTVLTDPVRVVVDLRR